MYAEPCFARELEWLLLDALRRMQEPDGEAYYLRLSTKPIDQAPFTEAALRLGEERLRADVIAGGFRLREPCVSSDRVVIAASGAIVPETLEAASQLSEEEGVEAIVLCLSSPDRLFHDWQANRTEALRGRATRRSHLESLLTPAEHGLPVVTVLDGASHALAFVGSALGSRSVALGVDRFGQTGSPAELYAEYGIDAEAIVAASLAALDA